MAQQLRAFLRLKQVLAQTGLSRSGMYSLMARGEFPKNFPISRRAVAWDSQHVADWQAGRIQPAQRSL